MHALFHYDPNNGLFIYRVSPSRRVSVGSIAGCQHNGYIRIFINRVAYKAHRLAWMYVHGKEPSNLLDHINGGGVDNRIANLREASNAENMQNTKLAITNKSGVTGVHWVDRDKRWRVRIGLDGQQKSIGSFRKKEDAIQACEKAKKTLHPFQTVFAKK
nr:HNH endonuclease [Massilia sp. CCM 8734]